MSTPEEMTDQAIRKGFQLVEPREDTAAWLRELEQNCPRPVSREIRAAMLQAAQKLEDWQRTAEDCARMLEEAQALRVGQMDSHARVDEIARQIKRAMADAAVKLRERLA